MGSRINKIYFISLYIFRWRERERERFSWFLSLKTGGLQSKCDTVEQLKEKKQKANNMIIVIITVVGTEASKAVL